METEDIIIDKVCGYFKVPKSKVISQSRKEEIVYARQIIHYFIREKVKMSFSQIGYITGNCSHSLVLGNHKKVKGWIDVDKHYRNQMNDIEERIDSEIFRYTKNEFKIYEFHVDGETIWICAKTIFQAIKWYFDQPEDTKKFEEINFEQDNITELPYREWDKFYIFDPNKKRPDGKPEIIESFYSYMLKPDLTVDCIASTLY